MGAKAGKQKTKKTSAVPGGQDERKDQVNEPAVEYAATIRAIGNSRGIILHSNLMDMAVLKADEDVIIRAVKGLITIKRGEKQKAGKDLSVWDKQFKAA